MGTRPTPKSTMIAKGTREFWFVSFVAIVAFVVSTRPAAAAQATEDIQVAPIECWTRTTADAVRIGETFTMVLTCAVLETAGTIVVPDETTLDPAALQLQPFDVISGEHPDDVRTSSRRLFQYEYTLRFIGETFGQDVMLPGPVVSYRVQSRSEQGGTLEGRTRQYNLPARPIRIVSLVPTANADLRDPATPTFAAIQQRRLRGRALGIGGLTMFVMSAAMIAWALVGALRRPSQQRSMAARPPSDAAVLRVVRRELDDVRRERQTNGWAPDLAARALRALRPAGSLAASGKVSYIEARNAAPSDGQLVVPSGWPRRTPMLVSGSAAAATLPDTAELGDLREALVRLTTAAYGRAPIDSDALDEALSGAERAVSRLARERGRLRLIKWAR